MKQKILLIIGAIFLIVGSILILLSPLVLMQSFDIETEDGTAYMEEVRYNVSTSEVFIISGISLIIGGVIALVMGAIFQDRQNVIKITTD